MNETILVGILSAAVMLIMVVYVALKDKETSRKIDMMEVGIETLNREIFKLYKEFDAIKDELESIQSLEKELSTYIDNELLDKMVNKKLKPFLLEIEHLRLRAEEVSEFKDRLVSLEKSIRQLVFANEHSSLDEKKILQLYEQGLDPQSIAKQLRLGKGEVELVLKFSRLNPS